MVGSNFRATSTRGGRTRCRVAVAAALALTASAAQAVEGDAKAILKGMSDYVGGQQAISFAFDSDIEVITPTLEKIQFTNSGTVLLSRPDKLRAHRVGGYADVELVFDGKAVSVFAKSLNRYAQAETQGTLDHLIDWLREGQGVALPGADLLRSDSHLLLLADVLEAKHIGRGVIDGVECEHLAFRNFDTDWQLWVEVGARPIPRKLVITSKTISGGPQYTVTLKDWKSGVEPAAGAFSFTPPAGASQLEPADFMKLDELPE